VAAGSSSTSKHGSTQCAAILKGPTNAKKIADAKTTGLIIKINETKASDLGWRERKEKAIQESLNPPMC
jgi:hypothetical protein